VDDKDIELPAELLSSGESLQLKKPHSHTDALPPCVLFASEKRNFITA
jgi:hypothetical protein